MIFQQAYWVAIFANLTPSEVRGSLSFYCLSHVCTENKFASSFRSPESFTSYDSLVSSSEAEGYSRLPFHGKRSGFYDSQRSQLEFASSSSEARVGILTL